MEESYDCLQRLGWFTNITFVQPPNPFLSGYSLSTNSCSKKAVSTTGKGTIEARISTFVKGKLEEKSIMDDRGKIDLKVKVFVHDLGKSNLVRVFLSGTQGPIVPSVGEVALSS